jgi:hypothetical protein
MFASGLRFHKPTYSPTNFLKLLKKELAIGTKSEHNINIAGTN